MPYYCTVPRCTSMAGKAKNVSFHQFPRDEELAKLWNNILKRGKPYTKYSKVCSLHFKPEDYTITSVGKNKGQWRTLRKDAIPSQNLPTDSPVMTAPHRSRGSAQWLPKTLPVNIADPQVQQQMAQAIYMQTMIAMQACTNGSQQIPSHSIESPDSSNRPTPHQSLISMLEIEQMQTRKSTNNSLHEHTNGHVDRLQPDYIEESEQEVHNSNQELKNVQEAYNSNPEFKKVTYKCEECSKCFKDPDVFILHKRIHKTKSPQIQEKLPDSISGGSEKENYNSNSDLTRQETLRANPILANLLKSGISATNEVQEPVSDGIFDTNNILSIENQIMSALAVNMESYIRNLSNMLQTNQNENSQVFLDSHNAAQDSQNCIENGDDDDSIPDGQNMAEEYQDVQGDHNFLQDGNDCDDGQNFVQDSHNFEQDRQNCVQDGQDFEQGDQNFVESPGLVKDELDLESNCDNEDFDNSKDSNSLVIDEKL